MKQEYGKERDKLLRETGQAVNKENFLSVYGRAHLRVLQPDLIKAAFRKTGIFPFNRDVVTAAMMAPSRDTAFKVFTPIVPPTPVRVITDLLVDALQPEAVSDNQETQLITPTRPLRTAIQELGKSRVGFLTSSSPIKSTSEPPDLMTTAISPIKQRSRCSPANNNIVNPLTMNVQTPTEKYLQEALIAKQSQVDFLKGRVMQLQSIMVLQRMYCGRVRRQLGAKELKGKKGKKGGKLHADGLPRLLTDDQFFQLVKEHDEDAAREKAEKAERQKAREDRDLAVEIWKKGEEERKQRNEEKSDAWKAAVAEWELEKAEAKAAGEKVKDWTLENPKPKKNDAEFKAEPAVPRPKLASLGEEGLDGDVDEDEDEQEWTDEEL